MGSLKIQETIHLPNKTNVECPRCSSTDGDTLAIITTTDGKVVVFRCLKCFKQFNKPLKEAKEKVPEFKKYFSAEKLEEN